MSRRACHRRNTCDFNRAIKLVLDQSTLVIELTSLTSSLDWDEQTEKDHLIVKVQATYVMYVVIVLIYNIMSHIAILHCRAGLGRRDFDEEQ